MWWHLPLDIDIGADPGHVVVQHDVDGPVLLLDDALGCPLGGGEHLPSEALSTVAVPEAEDGQGKLDDEEVRFEQRGGVTGR
jgi:hypothetical protein